MRALLAINDPSLRALWEGLLTDHGHPAESCGIGDATWARAREPGLDLVVVELVPDSTASLELCRQIRRLPEPRPSVLVLVHPDDASQMVSALKAGADDVLVGLPDRRAAITHLASLERRRVGVDDSSPTAAELAAGYQLAELQGPTPLSLVTAEPTLADLLARLHATAGDLAARLDATASRPDGAAIEPGLRAARNQAIDLATSLDRLKALNARPPAETAMPDAPAASAAPARRATILLIDDEPSVRKPLRRALEHCGFDVLEAADGQQGIEMFAQQHARIDAVVVDQYMPRMSGDEVAEELKRRSASTPVILISGQNAPDITDSRKGIAADAFLRKPFQLVDLARIVRRFVDTAAA